MSNMKKLPDLEAWAIFAKIAETGSFARAASDFSLSQATVSKAVNRLEKRMKTTLFHRTSRRISLTESGLAALEYATRILEEGETVEAVLAEQATKLCGTVRISAPMSFGLSYLAPLLPAFMQANPEVSLDIDFSDEIINLVANGFDLALRISTLADSSMLARRLCTVPIHLVGTPAYFKHHGQPHHPRDLATHRALQYAYSHQGPNWQFSHKLHGDFSQSMVRPLRVNNAEALTPALLAGIGLALQPEFLIWKELQEGRLIKVMEDWQINPIALHIVTPPGRRRPARVQAIIDYLAQCFSEAPWGKNGQNLSST